MRHPDPEQYIPALKRGAEIKEQRRKFLRDVKAGYASVAAVLRSDEIPDCLRRCSMHKLVTAYRSFPQKRYQRIMDEAGAGYARLVEEMTPRQLAIVARELDEWEKAHPVSEAVSA
jgi:hypothetical protein